MKIFVNKPKSIEYFKDKLVDLNNITNCDFGSFFHPTLETLTNSLIKREKNSGITLAFVNKKMKEEEYKLEIRNKKITIFSSSAKGIYYGLLTLIELKEENNEVKEQIINDYPDLKIRGFQLDISRNKVPKKETIMKIIDILSQYRFNHLELYVEGFSFEFKSQAFVYQNKNYLSVEEFLFLQNYANSKFIDLCASVNGFGHMGEWLQVEQYKHLAITDGLFEIWGSRRKSTTLDPTNERSAELVQNLYKDIIPYSNSKYFNMNFDEPYELGFNKTKDICDKVGKEKVFVDYFNKLASSVKQYGKIPFLWGDFLIHNPKAIKMLDKDAILIDWGYTEDYPFEKHAQMLQKQKRPYLLASGTSSWSVGTAKLQEMLGSTYNAASAALKYEAEGMILTDWGDFGHLQYFPYSYPGIIFAGMLMWNFEATSFHLLKEELNKLIGDNILAESLLELSEYHLRENKYRSYSTKLFNPIIQAELCLTEKEYLKIFLEKVRPNLLVDDEINKLNLYFDYIKEKLELVKKESVLKKQMLNSILLLKNLILVHQYLTKLDNNLLQLINNNFNEYLLIHEELWNLNNKKDGFDLSKKKITNLQNCLKELFDKYKKEAK